MTQKVIFKMCSFIMVLSGITIIFSTIYPILSYEWEAEQKYPILISPLVEKKTGDFKFSQKDYTKLNNWFNESEEEHFVTQKVKYFTISIPKLKIENATVSIGGNELSSSLIQYPGTALPGKIGNAVIFGHSILPQYFDPENYLSIFSTLFQLDEGDDILVSYDGITYYYKVENMFEVKPTDIQILEQSRSESYLSLVTCSPPGHPLKPRRLIVRAKLIPVDNLSLSL